MNVGKFLFLLFGLILIETNAKENHVQVTLKYGTIIGKKIWEQNRELAQFLGIPYAKPPIGELRFHRPQIFDYFKMQPFEALEWPNNCPQVVTGLNNASKYRNPNFVEDCLYLNIWSPNIKDEKLRPVIFFIHGGFFLFGSSAYHLYDGRTLSSLADAVVVTINYRVSLFGLLYSDEVDAIKGNMALWDQAMALEWVQENIRYFGGDPQAVTIIGESAGSWSVSSHIISPISRNMFRNAIMMSGSVHTYILTPKQLVQHFLKEIRPTGCVTESDQNINKRVVDCLKKIKLHELDTTQLTALLNGSGVHPYIIVDGKFIPKHPMEMLRQGDYKKNFNLLISTMEDESSGMLAYLMKQLDDINVAKKFLHSNPESITYEEAKNLLEKIIETFFENRIPSDNTISRVYFNGINPNIEHQDLFRRTVGIAFGDMWLACPSIDFGMKVFSRSPDQVAVYQIFNTFKMGNLYKDICSEWAGSCHADELYPLFGIPLRNPSKFLQRERDISMEWISIIKSFIRNGHPNKTIQPEWQSFFLGHNNESELIAPYYQLSNEFRTYKSYHLNYKQTECDLWKRYHEY